MTDKPRAKLTPQQQELVRKMRGMDEAARRQPERAPRNGSRLKRGCAIAAIVVFILLVVAAVASVLIMRAMAGAIFMGLGGHG